MDNAAFLVSDSPPRIVAQPASQIIPAGSTASFSVSSTGTAPLYFQWQRNGAPLSDGGNVSGSATPTLTLDRVSIGDDGGLCRYGHQCRRRGGQFRRRAHRLFGRRRSDQRVAKRRL